MSETDTGYGFPYIPLSRLRELKHHAEMVAIATQQGAFNGSDLWRVYVGLEVNALLANHWYEELEKARNYNPGLPSPCPLCVYDNGVFVASCSYHKIIGNLVTENNRLEQVVNTISHSLTEFFMQKAMETLKRGEETEKDRDAEILILSAGTESQGNRNRS